MTDWRERAACKGLNPSLFFTEKGPGRGDPYTEARKVCATCPVTAECLEVGIAEKIGMWGGLSPKERRTYRRRAGRRLLQPVSSGAKYGVPRVRHDGKHGLEATFAAGCRCYRCTLADRRVARRSRAEGSMA